MSKLSEEDKLKIGIAKDELKKYRDNRMYLQEKKNDLEELENMVTSTTAKWSKTKTTNSGFSSDKFSSYMERAEAIYEETSKRLEELLVNKFLIDDKIDKMSYPYRDVLFLRYSRCYSWRDVAQKVGYSEQDIYTKHGQALLIYANL
ncbi:MAG: hypothetical protein IJ629_06105 [Clostridia bacterium]|nr:hypothetical protein [Clostridia bacterium]